MFTFRISFLALFLLLAGALLSVTPVTAQTAGDVQITREHIMEVGGTLGTLLRLMPGFDETTLQVTSIHGEDPIVRTDSEGASTIIDYETGEMINEDHDDRSFFRFLLSDALGRLSDVRSAQQVEIDEAMADVEAQDSDVEYEISVSVERPGETKMSAGRELELVRVIITAKPVRAEDVDPDQLPSTVLISDSWMADQDPGAEAYQRIAGAALGSLSEVQGGEMGMGMQQASAMNKGIGASYEEMAEEVSKFEGFPYETVVAFVSLMPGVELDVQAAMEAELAGPDIDLGAIVREAAKESAKQSVRNAARSRMGRFGGLLGGRNEDKEEEPEEATGPTQIVIIRVTDRTQTVVVGAIEGAWTQANPEYEEKENPFLQPVG